MGFSGLLEAFDSLSLVFRFVGFCCLFVMWCVGFPWLRVQSSLARGLLLVFEDFASLFACGSAEPLFVNGPLAWIVLFIFVCFG